jgi:hypothetical protein
MAYCKSTLPYGVGPVDPVDVYGGIDCSGHSDLVGDVSSRSPRIPSSAGHRAPIESVNSFAEQL